MVEQKYKCNENDLLLIQKAGETLKKEKSNLSSKLLSFSIDINSNVVSREVAIDLFRDAAIYLEVIDIDISYELMSLALLLRPNGKFIQKKVSEFRVMLQIKYEGICILGNLNMQFGTIQSHTLLKALAKGSYEQNEVNLLEQFLEKDEIVLELGAGIGYMGLIAIKSGLCKRYVAYEANPNLIQIIKKNMERNNAFFELHNEILLDKEVKKTFYIMPDFWASSLIKPINSDYEKIDIESQNKNDIVKSMKPTMLIIDIEGGEVDFFNNLDISTVKKIILEIHPNVLSDKSLSGIYSFLLKEGFVLNFKSSFRYVLYWYK